MIPGAEIGKPTDETVFDPETGAVKSRQAADIVLPADAVAGIWNPEHLERVARTYWATLRRFTLGLIHVHYTPTERAAVRGDAVATVTWRSRSVGATGRRTR